MERIAKEFNVDTERMKRKLRNLGFYYNEKAGKWFYML